MANPQYWQAIIRPLQSSAVEVLTVEITEPGNGAFQKVRAEQIVRGILAERKSEYTSVGPLERVDGPEASDEEKITQEGWKYWVRAMCD